MDAKTGVGEKKPAKVWTTCPECGTALDKKKDCVLCPKCGWGLCS